RLFLIDEDTSATNFMVRDDFMQQVISREKEPITPFLERARDLYEKAGVSTILVAGSSGAFFYIADRILQMDCYKPIDITGRVKPLCEKYSKPRIQAPGFEVSGFGWAYGAKRLTGGSGRDRGVKVKTFGRDGFSIDRENVELRYVEQLADQEQTQALAYLLRYALERVVDGRRNTRQIVKALSDIWEQKGWEAFCQSYVPCGLAKPRLQELFACLNRYRG
ncbi:MAG: ABC-ATPase domain-containing protein, partial [Clostridiales bacterium]|nr:ABC-ATPase domain-containing protein [Clostridiales bacterium]